MSVYRVTPAAGAPCLRCATSLAKATARALAEFPAGVLAVALVDLPELDQLMRAGAVVPMHARRRVEVYRAVQRERQRGERRLQAARQKVREEARQKKTVEQARKVQLKAQQRAERAAEREAAKRRRAAAARRAQRSAENEAARLREEAQQVEKEPVGGLELDDMEAPWEE